MPSAGIRGVSRFGRTWFALVRNQSVPPSHRAAQAWWIRQRIAALAPVVALLNLAWIPFDPIALDSPRAWSILPVRLSVAAALVAIDRADKRIPAMHAARLLIWVQAIGFGVIQWLAQPLLDSSSQAGYSLFPFVIVAQLAAFPLAWTQTLRLALAPAALAVALRVTDPGPLRWWHDLWLFGLGAALAAWSSQSQLRLLLDLLGARHDAAVDPLTGLANRREAHARLDGEMARAGRYGEPLSLLMLDIDHFKAINDRFGHVHGDHVLQAMARAVLEELRTSDLAARVGGEEFLVVLPNTTAEQATEVAERIRTRVAGTGVRLPEATVAVTVSLGIARWRPGEPQEELIGRVDDALYRAKSQGRNRCVLAGAEARLASTPPVA